MSNSPLLGNHKISVEWYTPDHVWDKVFITFGFDGCDEELAFYSVFDPCLQLSDKDGLKEDWTRHKFVYCNPPSPAADWALKAIETVNKSKDTAIIFAAFSNDLFNQVNQLEDYPHVKCRKRVRWVDGREFLECKQNYDAFDDLPDNMVKIDKKYYFYNPDYMKESSRPSRYCGFILLYQHDCTSKAKGELKKRFAQQFFDLGTVQLSRTVYKP